MARILVIGGSLGGLMAANLLLRAGHDVQVLERSASSLEGRGAGIVTHRSLHQALAAAGAVVDDTLGVAVESRVVLRPDGEAQCRWHYPQILTSWGRLYSLLRAALPSAHHHLGCHVTQVQQDSQGVSVVLASGATWQGDLLVAADGVRSTVRSQLLPAVQAQYAGYVAWRGVCDEAALSRHTLATLFPHFGFGLPPGEQLIGYPVAGADHGTAAGTRRWNYVWYRPTAAGADLQALMTDADGVHHPQGVPPQQVSWRHIAALRESARQLLAPQLAEIVEKTAVPFFQPIYDLVSTGLAHGRVALLGDAAFVARPHVGMGVAKAGDDAVALARCVAAAGATPQALALYHAERHPAGLAVVQRARLLGAYLEAQQHQPAQALGQPSNQPAPAQPAAEADPDGRARDVMQQTAIDSSLFEQYRPSALAA